MSKNSPKYKDLFESNSHTKESLEKESNKTVDKAEKVITNNSMKSQEEKNHELIKALHGAQTGIARQLLADGADPNCRTKVSICSINLLRSNDKIDDG